MSEKPTLLISPENQQTVLAVSFVLALLAVVFNFYNFNQIGRLTAATSQSSNTNVATIEKHLTNQAQTISALEAKVTAMDGKMSTMSHPAPAAPATPVDTKPVGQ